MKLTYNKKLEIERNGKEALAYVESTTELSFSEFDNGNYRVGSNGVEYGILLTNINSDGMVVVTWVPKPAYDNYAKETRFKYDATDNRDNTVPFLTWLNEIKEDLGL